MKARGMQVEQPENQMVYVHIVVKRMEFCRISHQILLQTWELDELYGVIRKYQPEPFLYGHGRTARVAKIQCKKLQNVRTIYES